MRRLRDRAAVAVLAAGILMTLVAASPAPGSPSPSASPQPASPCPTQAATASPSPAPSPACDSGQALLDSVKQQLGNTLADALRVETELTASLHSDVFAAQQLGAETAALTVKIAALDAEIASLQKQIDLTAHRIEIERGQIAALARSMYAQPTSLLLLLAQSQSLSDALSRTSQFVLAGSRAEDTKVRLLSDLRQLQAEQVKLQADRQQEEREHIRLQSFLGQASLLQGQSLVVSDQLRLRVNQILGELSASGGQSPVVADAVRRKIAADTGVIITEARILTLQQIRLLLELSQARSPTGTPLIPAEPPSATSISARLGWPLEHAVITQGFGPSPYAYEPPFGQYPHFHTGVDLAAAENSPILAAADGVVMLVARDPWGYGNYIVISHSGGLATLYGHLNAVTVAVGESVLQGQQIGLEGSTGISTGPHLHFEVRIGGAPVNPMPYLVGA